MIQHPPPPPTVPPRREPLTSTAAETPVSPPPDPFSFISSPEHLTVDVLSQLLQQSYHEPVRVTSMTTSTRTVAILSQVVEINVTLSSTSTNLPTAYIAKFLKPSLPLKEMFRVEGTFYQHYAHDVGFFSVPRAIYCGPRLILLVKEPDATPLDLLTGCPDDTVVRTLLQGLAQLHAHGWSQSLYSDLSRAPGIGSSLQGLAKERMFATCYPGFLDRLLLADDENPDKDTAASSSSSTHAPIEADRLLCLCQDLSTRRTRDVHEAVHGYRPTLIHGDFHVGNLLHRKATADNAPDEWCLLDWATCGLGNPFMDVLFFLLVSTRATPHEIFHEWLPVYYEALLQADAAQHRGISKELMYDSCVDLFRECVLDEFLILVCYDELSRSLVQQETPERQEFFLAHFAKVNRRCVELVLSSDMTGYPLPPHKTAQEVEMEINDMPEWRLDHAVSEL